MESAPYHFVELNSETVMHAVELQNKIGEEISEEEIELFADALEKENNVANQTLGAQKGFIVFQRDKAVAYLGNAYESTVGQLITQNLGGFVTDPEIRSIKLLTAIKNRVLQTQHPGYAYLYTAWAEPKTSYKGLVQPGVQK